MDSLQESARALQSLCVEMKSTTHLTIEMLSWADEVLDNLCALSGPHARNAESEVRAAQAALREALTTWQADYIQRSENLCRRITS
jgi:hypothetical protein